MRYLVMNSTKVVAVFMYESAANEYVDDHNGAHMTVTEIPVEDIHEYL